MNKKICSNQHNEFCIDLACAPEGSCSCRDLRAAKVILHHVSRRDCGSAIRKLNGFGAAGLELASWQHCGCLETGHVTSWVMHHGTIAFSGMEHVVFAYLYIFHVCIIFIHLPLASLRTRGNLMCG